MAGLPNKMTEDMTLNSWKAQGRNKKGGNKGKEWRVKEDYVKSNHIFQKRRGMKWQESKEIKDRLLKQSAKPWLTIQPKIQTKAVA